ncbi:PREDICTED: LOW QUALITY PROTEIN: ubiquitin carboxyl-terminal hydrolase CYLD-like [Priapulus caudatus]|uniref:ubiquitinyl hydrolase 1 n=1 Tax=Priapulus caudatus TaxID=37621 RepID=A0ABM1DZM4_PRICU|nr:PREDICTED: LOW QUALITY PROTEIN: ubiquitin carboxyl-terminal hydrolase CYLD-like [Priapulus caudatus]
MSTSTQKDKTARIRYILLEDKYGQKRQISGMVRQFIDTEIEVEKGILLKLLDDVKDKRGIVHKEEKKVQLASIEREDVTLVCSVSDIFQLSSVEADLLLAISSPAIRMQVLHNDEWLREGSSIKEGDLIDVYLHGLSKAASGIVRYRGTVLGFKGTMFGIEMTSSSEILQTAATDGVWNEKQYFECPIGKGLFLPLSQIRLRVAVIPLNSRKGRSEKYAATAESPFPSRTLCVEPPLATGDRIVWMSDIGPEHGLVRWIGYLPEVGPEWTVGVQFDHPVGTGTGRYHDRQLFETKPKYASLIPILGLMREDEFLQQTVKHGVTGCQVVQEQKKILQQLEDKQQEQKSSIKSGTFSSISKNSRESLHRVVLTERDHPVISSDRKGSLTPYTHYEDVTELGIKGHIVQKCDLEVGSMVEVNMSGLPKYGVIRWIGIIPESSLAKPMAGVEMDEESVCCTEGTVNCRQYFQCPPKKGFFLYLHLCKKDSRFLEHPKSVNTQTSCAFGNMDSPCVEGDIPPPDIDDVSLVCGKSRGIQGHSNSCYLDATLFSMFAFTQVFDTILHRPKYSDDINEYEQVQKVLRDEFVNPLRQNMYVRADRVMKLRKFLDQLTSVSGLTGEEKDPEEFLNSLNQIFKADPFLKLSSGQDAYLYQVFMERDDKMVLPTVQQLFEESFVTSDLKLKEIPSCFIIQMPRFGKDYKMYKRIVPSLVLDITDVLENSPRQCSMCGMLAELECKQCFRQFGECLENISFCRKCIIQRHSHAGTVNHEPREILVPSEFQQYLQEQTAHEWQPYRIPRVHLELFAVVCIATSHYVAFVKSGSGLNTPWVFFDSMADRKGEEHGYNIPEICACPDLTTWLSGEGYSRIMREDPYLPDYAQRLLSDGYICMYQSSELMLYK